MLCAEETARAPGEKTGLIARGTGPANQIIRPFPFLFLDLGLTSRFSALLLALKQSEC